MNKYVMNKYAFSKQGTTNYIRAVIACTFSNIVLMLPIMLIYMLVESLINGVIIPNNDYYIYGFGTLVMVCAIFVTQWVQYHFTFETVYKESALRRLTLAEKIRKLPLSFFGKRDLTDTTSIIMDDCAMLENAFSHFYPQFAGAIISTSITAISLFVFDPIMALSAIWVVPVAFAVVFLSKSVQRKVILKSMKVKLECADGIQECLELIRELKTNNAESKYLVGLEKKIVNVEKMSIVSEFAMALFVVSAQLILRFGIVSTVLIGSIRLVDGNLDVMVFFMFLLVVSRLYDPLSATLEHLAAIVVMDERLVRTKAINEYPIQEGAMEFTTDGFDIEFENVGFSYNADKTVLKDVSFVAKQGEVTALIGPSGGGKSTIAKLAARFWDIEKGKITVGGTDVNKVYPESLLSLYSIVFQDVTLFNNTVMENIRIGKIGATDEEVLNAANRAQCDIFVSRMANGYNTVIGENGAKLSGGERQRISIARAMLKDSPIVLLDEATASLDAENETQIQLALSGLVKDKTVLIIAHRLRTVENADKIIVLEEGLVAEMGTPSELKSLNGKYANMLSLQKNSSEWSL